MVNLFEKDEKKKAYIAIANLPKDAVEALDIFLDYWQKVFLSNLSGVNLLEEDKVVLKTARNLAASLNALKEIQYQIHTAPSEVQYILKSDKSAKEKEEAWKKLTEDTMSRMQGFDIVVKKPTPKGGK